MPPVWKLGGGMARWLAGWLARPVEWLPCSSSCLRVSSGVNRCGKWGSRNKHNPKSAFNRRRRCIGYAIHTTHIARIGR